MGAEKVTGCVILRSRRRRRISEAADFDNAKILRGVYPETGTEIFRYAQNDRGRRAQNDSRNDFFSTLLGDGGHMERDSRAAEPLDHVLPMGTIAM